MVWWVGGDVKIVLSQPVMDRMNDEQCQLILAHEMAHVCRRDYLVRWLEWLARAAFWWNPIAWWAQRSLRAVEETCCDEFVLSKLNPSAKSYANTILTTVESLVSPVIRPPAMASEINSGGFLERRIEKILTQDLIQQPTRRRSVLPVYFALFVIPFGFVNARDIAQEHQQVEAAEHETIEAAGPEALAALKESLRKRSEDSRRKRRVIDPEAMIRRSKARIEAAVARGELTKEEGDVRLLKLKSTENIELLQWICNLRNLIEAGELTDHEAEKRLQARARELQLAR